MSVARLPDYIIELLVAYSRRELTDNEYDVLSGWLLQHEESIELVNEYLRLLNSIHSISIYDRLKTDTAWSVVHNRTSHKPGWKKLRSLSFFKCAASIILPIIALGTILWCFSVVYIDRKQAVNSEVLKSGRANAILELNGGKSIVLGTGIEKDIHSFKGTIFTKDSVDVIRYFDNRVTEVQFNKLSVPKGGEYKLVLADGTKVWLNSETKVRYPTRFTGDVRNIYLLSGEIFLEVAEDKEKPFIVNGNNYQVEVLGTGFNIRDYQDEFNCTTTLLHGSVKVKNINTLECIVIQPNQQVKIKKEGSMSVLNVNARQSIGWINGVLYYNNASLEQILKDLSRWYSFDYEFEDAGIAELKFAGGISRYNDIEQVIDVITSTNKLNVTIEGNLIKFSYR